jgi:hypothetical protein
VLGQRLIAPLFFAALPTSPRLILENFMPRFQSMLVSLTAAVVLIGGVLAPSAAQAQKKNNVIVLDDVTITGRVQKPVAAVDISRIAPKLSLSELRQPFLEKIEKVIYSAPF